MASENSGGFSDVDSQYMAEALDLARKGLYTSMPNPRVGCVLVNNNCVVGRGWHNKAGEPHAEINALQQAASAAQGATAYVSLEPCNYQGRTGPCTEALISAGIKRVVYAAQDPNPKVCGEGHARLIAAGVEVQSGLLASRANALNRGFIKRMQHQLPFVNAKMAMSLDGKTAMASGESQWITGPEARAQVQQLRAQSCTVLTGVGTILQDNPSLTVREKELGQWVERQPKIVIVDTGLKTPLDSKVIVDSLATGREVIFACGEAATEQRRKQLQSQGFIVKSFSNEKNDKVHLLALLQYLAQQEMNEVMLEAGATLFSGFIEAGLVDELQLFVAPKFMGSSARSLLALPFSTMSESLAVDIADVQAVGKDWWLRCIPQAMQLK